LSLGDNHPHFGDRPGVDEAIERYRPAIEQVSGAPPPEERVGPTCITIVSMCRTTHWSTRVVFVPGQIALAELG
jgi:hypothetical protein